MAYLFLYDPDSVIQDTITVMRRKGYECTALTNQESFFWDKIEALPNDSTFVLVSHGDRNGPLGVAGNDGDDINLERFAEKMVSKHIRLYLLSCYTGKDPCGTELHRQSVNFVAPLGCAAFETVGSEGVHVKSKDGNQYPGWEGPLSPSRASKPLLLPSNDEGR